MELLPWMAPVEHRGEPPGPLVVVECIMSGAERARLLFAWDTDYFLWLDFVELLFPASLSLPSVYDLQCAAVEDSFIPADTSPDTAEYIAICMEKPSRRGAPGDYRDVWIRLPDTPEVRKLAPGDLCWKYSIHLGSKGEGPSVNLACKMEFGGRS